MLKRLSAFMVLLLMSGCFLKPSPFEMADAEYGQVPDSYVTLITLKLQENLPNPHAAKIEVSQPYPAVRFMGIWNGGNYEYGHVVHAWITPHKEYEGAIKKSSKIFWWNHTGWSTMLPNLEGVTPKYPQQAEEYAGVTYTRY